MAPSTVSLHPLEGHEAIREALTRAFLRGVLPQVLLLHGPPGVGKQRFALWLGQLLVCSAPGADAGPCGECRGCNLALRLEHPDLNWYMPVVRPSARGSREREDEALEDARITRLEELRSTPLQPSHSDEVRALHLGTVRNLRKHARRGPTLGSRQLFVLADAEELAPHESSPAEAANALLKLLEEPPPGTWFVLTSSEAGRLLPTIRSRTTALHLAALPESRVAEFLESSAGAGREAAEKAARLSGGAIGRALGFLPLQGGGSEDGALDRVRKEAFHLLRAAISPNAADRYTRALALPPSGARGLQELLSSLEGWLRDLGVAASGHGEALLNLDAGEWLAKTVREREIHPLGPTRALGAVEEARAQAAGNVNPQLLVHSLLLRLRRELIPTDPAVADPSIRTPLSPNLR